MANAVCIRIDQFVQRLAFLGQATMAVGLKQDVVERVPDYVERS